MKLLNTAGQPTFLSLSLSGFLLLATPAGPLAANPLGGCLAEVLGQVVGGLLRELCVLAIASGKPAQEKQRELSIDERIDVAQGVMLAGNRLYFTMRKGGFRCATIPDSRPRAAHLFHTHNCLPLPEERIFIPAHSLRENWLFGHSDHAFLIPRPEGAHFFHGATAFKEIPAQILEYPSGLYEFRLTGGDVHFAKIRQGELHELSPAEQGCIADDCGTLRNGEPRSVDIVPLKARFLLRVDWHVLAIPRGPPDLDERIFKLYDSRF
ncbi:MAG: hypothetical protein NXI24_10895 [bacterium]|nr:hypothetical protein [bacterium]